MAEKINNTYFFRKAGGGGSASEAVKYTEQTLTEAQQMQARKNQGLYYTEGTPAGVITWDGNTEGKEKVDLDFYSLYKIADAPADLPGDKIIKVLNASNEEFTFGTQSMNPISGYLVGGECTLGSEHGAFFIANNPHLEYPTPFEGLVGIYVSDNVRTIEYDAYGETIHQIPSEYLPITTSLSASSTDEEIPSAKSVYDYIINNPPTGVVRYDAAQSLNNTQKNQAIQNLGIENKIGSFMTIDQNALENDWSANISYDKMYSIIRGGGNIAAYVSKNIEEIVDGFPEYTPIVIGTFSGEIIGERNAWPREDKIVFSNVIYGESSLEINTITFLPSSDSTPSGTFAKYTFNATKTTTP